MMRVWKTAFLVCLFCAVKIKLCSCASLQWFVQAWGAGIAIAAAGKSEALGSAINGGIQAGPENGPLYSATLAGLGTAVDNEGCDSVKTPILNAAKAATEQKSSKADAAKVYCKAIQSVGELEQCVPQLFPNSSGYDASLCA